MGLGRTLGRMDLYGREKSFLCVYICLRTVISSLPVYSLFFVLPRFLALAAVIAVNAFLWVLLLLQSFGGCFVVAVDLVGGYERLCYTFF